MNLNAGEINAIAIASVSFYAAYMVGRLIMFYLDYRRQKRVEEFMKRLTTAAEVTLQDFSRPPLTIPQMQLLQNTTAAPNMGDIQNLTTAKMGGLAFHPIACHRPGEGDNNSCPWPFSCTSGRKCFWIPAMDGPAIMIGNESEVEQERRLR